MELVEGIEVVGSLPMLYVRSVKTLIFADSHLGFEEEMSEKGIYIPRVQLSRLLKMLEEALSLVSPNTVVIAGDVKHIFGKLGRVERQELTSLFEFLRKNSLEVILVRGNHDNFVKPIARKYNIEVVDYYNLTPDIAIVHGHKVFDELQSKILIMGHEHPSISLRDLLGVRVKVPCFLVTSRGNQRLIVIPASGVYQSGTSVSLDPNSYLSPYLRDINVLKIMKPYALVEGEGVVELPQLQDLVELMVLGDVSV